MRRRGAEQLLITFPTVRGKVPTARERRTLLSKLPEHADHLKQRGIKRAIREALQLRWVVWEGSTLHTTEAGRVVLASLQQSRAGAS